MLEMLLQKIHTSKISNVEVLLSSGNEIPLENESVDLLISINTLHEFSNKENMVAEAERALKKTGKMLIADFKKEDA